MKPVFNDTFEGVFVADAKGNVIALDRACERLFGYRADEIVDKPAAILLPMPELALADAHFGEHVAGGRSVQAGRQRFGRRKDGTTFPVEFSIVHTMTPTGDSLFVGVIHEIKRDTSFKTALHEGEEQLKAVVDTVVDGVILIDSFGSVQMFNPACETMFGYRRDEVVGRNLKMLMPTPYHEAHDRHLENYRRSGVRRIIGTSVEVEGRRKDGTIFPLEVSIGETQHKGGPLFVGIVRDITERKLFKKELEESAEQLKAIVDTAVDGVILIDSLGSVRMFNPACERIFGYRLDEVVGCNVKMLMPTPFHEEHDRYLENYRRSGERKIIGIGREVEGRRKDGTTFPMELSVGEARHKGEPLFVGIIRDITERKQFKKELEESAEQLRAVVDTAVDGVILIDSLGSVRMFNPACESVFGYQQDEVVGRNVKMLMPTPFHEEHDHYLENYRRSGVRKIIGIGRAVEGRRKDGTTFPMELSVGEARHNGEPLFVGIIRDITKRKQSEDQRELLLKQLTESNIERGHFAHVAAHDLGQSVRMVSSFCGLLSGNYGDQLDERGRQYVSIMASAARTMQALLDDIVEHGRLDFEKGDAAWFDAGKMLEEVLHSLNEPIEKSGAVVTNDPLPKIWTIPVRFARVLQNLVANAIKYVPAGVKPSVHVSVTTKADEWVFSVADNGIGIDPEYHARIFQPFKRLHTAREYSGAGMGLAICKKIVEGLGGRISVESSPGGGSIFSFSVRRRQEGAQDD
jgi:two-component system, LuxR family, sensor kinase FixL